MVRSILEKKAEWLFIYIGSRPVAPWVDYFFKAVFILIWRKTAAREQPRPPRQH